MATITRMFTCSARDVWNVLADGWLYPSWVVGASRMRDVEGRWPEPGATLHHSVGTWPILINDRSYVTAAEPGRRLELVARGWPLGEAKVDVTMEDVPGGCQVSITEDAIRGPGLAVPKLLRDPTIRIRNQETLKRLQFLAEGKAGEIAGSQS
jgi:Polyketide cyclase / dehydrase and lipid transport